MHKRFKMLLKNLLSWQLAAGIGWASMFQTLKRGMTALVCAYLKLLRNRVLNLAHSKKEKDHGHL